MTDALQLAYLSATQQLRLFRTGHLTPTEVLEAQIARAEQVEPHVNAFTATFIEDARTAAAEATDRYARGEARPLEGITVAVKDDTDIRGRVTTQGSEVFIDHVAERTHPVVQRLLEAGAIVHAKTTVPEFCLDTVTWSKPFGVTRNPWNLHYTCGGSSGGSGAALASGTTTLATGSDAGGSVRLPAAVNGLYGYKPPFGRNPSISPWTLVTQAVYGPLARTLGDLRMMQDIMSGPHPDDPTSLPKVALPQRPPSVAGWRLAYSPDFDYSPIDPEIRKNTEHALQRFQALGAVVEEVSLGWTQDALRAFYVLTLGGYWGEYLQGIAAIEAERITPLSAASAARAADVTSQDVGAAAAIAAAMNRSLAALFEEGFAALLAPTTALAALRADHDAMTDEVFIGDVEVDGSVGWALTWPFNLLHLHPVVVVPSGRTSSNVPSSLQIVAAKLDDPTAFALAHSYERVAEPLFTGDAFPDFREG